MNQRCGMHLSWVHLRAIPEAKNEFESRPNFIHGADLDVHQTGGKTDVPDNVLGKISCDAGALFLATTPKACLKR